MRVTTQQGGEHHGTIPDHASLRVGTLANILGDVALHLEIDRAALVEALSMRELCICTIRRSLRYM